MINWAKVSELRDEIGAEDFGEVVEIFLEEVDDAIERMRSKIDVGGETSKLECGLHFLKGSALNLGFRQFSTLCQAGETAAAEGHPDTVDLAEILASYDASKAVFVAELDAQLAG